MTDAYEAKWLLAFINDDPTGLNLTQRAADLGCAPTVEAVTEALRVIADHCGRGPCWKEGGHEGPCEPGGRDDPRRAQAPEVDDHQFSQLVSYLAKMDQAGGGIYTTDFRDGFRHALAMLVAYESDDERAPVRVAARNALSRRTVAPATGGAS